MSEISFPPPGETQYVGKGATRVDARAKVTGQATYAAEFEAPGLVHAAVVRSSIANGRVTTIDVDRAREAEGVIALFYPGKSPDIRSASGTPDAVVYQQAPPSLSPEVQDNAVLYAGQIVAVALAETLEQAEHAANLIAVEYERDEPVITLDQASDRIEYPEQGLRGALQHEIGSPDAVLEEAAAKVDATYEIAVENHHPMEMHAVLAHWDRGNVHVWSSTQGVIAERNAIAVALDVPAASVRVTCPYVGGGFGSKGVIWPHVATIAAIARTIDRPVRYMLTRQEMTYATGHRPATRQTIRIGATNEGKVQAIEHTTISESAEAGQYVEACSNVSGTLYDAQAIRMRQGIAALHRPVPGFMRGPGENPGAFALETAIDELSYETGRDPVQIRLDNQPEANPLDGKPWTLRRTADCLRRGAERIGWSERSPEPRSMRDGDWLVGMGCAVGTYPGARWNAKARVRMNFDGSVTVSSATQDLGTGTYTIIGQVVAEMFGIDPSRVRTVLGDSDLPEAGTSGGSTTAASVVPAVIEACRQVQQKIARIASTDQDGPLSGTDPNGITVGAGGVAAGNVTEQYAALLTRNANRWSPRDAPEAIAATGTPEEMGDYACVSTCAHFCRVGVRESTGEWRIERWAAVYDVGRILNERLARSQLKGGVIYGIGAAMMEATATDPRTGRVITRGLADYHVPVHADLPEIEVDWLGEPDPIIGPLGNRGIGEIGIVGVAPALGNAIYHATGRRLRSLPMTPEAIMAEA